MSTTKTNVAEITNSTAAAPTSIAVPPKPVAQAQTATAEQQEQQSIYSGKTAEEIFAMFGGEQARGAISGAMRAMAAAGYTTSAIAKALNKRYQHVRNVLNEPTQKAIPTPNCSVTLPEVSLLKKPEQTEPVTEPTVKKDEPKKDEPKKETKQEPKKEEPKVATKK